MSSNTAVVQVGQALVRFKKYPDQLEAAPLLAWSGWSKWSNYFQRLVNQQMGVNQMNTHTLPWLNLRKSLAHVDHPDQPSVYAGFSGPSSFENAPRAWPTPDHFPHLRLSSLLTLFSIQLPDETQSPPPPKPRSSHRHGSLGAERIRSGTAAKIA